jgi:hypothetical protein
MCFVLNFAASPFPQKPWSNLTSPPLTQVC